MDWSSIIVELGRVLNIELALNEQKTCGVFFDNDEIIIEQHESQLYLIADLVPEEDSKKIFRRLLVANYLGAQSGQACLGIDEHRNMFTLHRILDGEMNYREFENILSTFVQSVRYWKEWINVNRKEASDQNLLKSNDLIKFNSYLLHV